MGSRGRLGGPRGSCGSRATSPGSKGSRGKPMSPRGSMPWIGLEGPRETTGMFDGLSVKRDGCTSISNRTGGYVIKICV